MKFVKHTSGKTSNDEQALLAEYRRNGDLEVLGKLYEPYMPLTYGLCLKYLKDEDESKDAVMQIFEQLVDKLRIHEVSNFKSWLYTLARNYCLMVLRAAGKHQTVSLDVSMENDSFVHHDNDEVHENQLKLMEACMEKLPGDQASCLRLFYLEQKCYKEISGITHYEMNKVKSYIQNGKRNLKICMDKNGKG